MKFGTVRARLIAAIREADQKSTPDVQTTSQYVREYLLLEMEKRQIKVIDLKELDRLQAIETRAKEVLAQRHGDRYGSLWINTFHFILTGEDPS